MNYGHPAEFLDQYETMKEGKRKKKGRRRRKGGEKKRRP